MPGDKPTPPSHRRARTLGYGAFGVLVGGITLVFATQILEQTFWPPSPPAEVSCPKTLQDMWQALARARQSASEHTEERAKLAAFRSGLLPEWGQRVALERACDATPQAALARHLIRLRFLEEQRARTGSGELTQLRELTQRQLEQLGEAERAHP